MRISLFVTCLVDQLHPEVGRAVVRLFDRLGLEYEVPGRQTCCGQPAFNAGFSDEARQVARSFLDVFADREAIVAPSGSCVGMVRRHYPSLFPTGSADHARAVSVASRTWELTEFLVSVLRCPDVGAVFPARVTYHDSCHLLRELGVREQPRQLLGHVRGLELVEMNGSDICCGFGGVFSVKYPEISGAMGREKLQTIVASGASTVVACDTGCLMHLRGLISRERVGVRALHIAQILAGGSDA